MAGSAAGFGPGFSARLYAGFFATGGSAAGSEPLGVAGFVAAGGVGRHGSLAGLLSRFGVVGGGIRFGSGGIVLGVGFGGFRHYFFAAHRHEEITLGSFAQA